MKNIKKLGLLLLTALAGTVYTPKSTAMNNHENSPKKLTIKERAQMIEQELAAKGRERPVVQPVVQNRVIQQRPVPTRPVNFAPANPTRPVNILPVNPTVKSLVKPVEQIQTIGKNKIANKFKQNSCPKCEKEFTNNDTNLVRLSCGHVFHEDCIDNWFGTVGGIDKQTGSVTWQEKNRRCPICKFDVRGKYETEKLERLFTQEAKKSGININPVAPRQQYRETKDYIIYTDEFGIERILHKK